ncbi:small ribosomal subunit protein uS14m isoform X2 [Anopheles ziemanni]|uniref:small ribosomal subunit protein uS14m isoform X2 n=1 Tax=Anopheles coustani TaxID=139045 RepID=UPI0026594598|nr:small ribosomal subunit protein uS14m isoform X2 [Anopheles coustani]XP_058166673.1 small ribosomal subunit protein uS14m isoform X2 [Anopheles ziemanni]
MNLNDSLLRRFAVNGQNLAGYGFQQVRNKWADWRMIKDHKRRQCVVQHAEDRLRVNSLRKNTILPIELREIASKEIDAFPRDSSLVRVRERCAVTSRPRGIVHRWRVSRIVWRHMADYNKLSGVQRAMW